MPGRKFNLGSTYRYGFNGKEDDRDAGEGIQDYGMRIYDVRIARFLSVDPLTEEYPFYTPYQFAANNPLMSIDVDGLEANNNPNANETPAGQPLDLPNNAVVNAFYHTAGMPLIGGGNAQNSIAKIGSVQNFSIGDQNFSASYWNNTGEFAGYYDQKGNRYVRGNFKDVIPEATFGEKAAAFGKGVVKGAVAVAAFTAAAVIVTATCGAAAPFIIGAATAYGAYSTATSAYSVLTGDEAWTGRTLSDEEYWDNAGQLLGGGVTARGVKSYANSTYSSKVTGRPQSTGTTGHAEVSNAYATLYSMNPMVEKVTLNRRYSSLTGERAVGTNRLPDVGVGWRNGRVTAVEVASKTDILTILRTRNEFYMRQNSITGKVTVDITARILNKISPKKDE